MIRSFSLCSMILRQGCSKCFPKYIAQKQVSTKLQTLMHVFIAHTARYVTADIRQGPVLLLVMLLTMGCTTYRPLEVDVLQPASVDIPRSIDTVVLINRTQPLPGRSGGTTLSTANGEVDIHHFLASEALKSLQYVLEQSPRFVPLRADVPGLEGQGKRVLPPLGPAVADSLARAYSASGVIALDRLIYEDDYKIIRESSGYQYRTDVEVLFRYTWRLYSPGKKQPVDVFQQKDSLTWGEVFYSLYDAEQSLPDRTATVRHIGQWIGEKFGFRIAPVWIKAKRGLYVNHPKLKEGEKAALAGEWEQAAKHWLPYTKSDNRILAEYASMNMALAAEMLGKTQIALHWVQKAQEYYQSARAEAYGQQLEQRLEEEKQLKRQFQ